MPAFFSSKKFGLNLFWLTMTVRPYVSSVSTGVMTKGRSLDCADTAPDATNTAAEDNDATPTRVNIRYF